MAAVRKEGRRPMINSGERGFGLAKFSRADEEKWRRIIENRKKQGRGLTRWESGGKNV